MDSEMSCDRTATMNCSIFYSPSPKLWEGTQDALDLTIQGFLPPWTWNLTIKGPPDPIPLSQARDLTVQGPLSGPGPPSDIWWPRLETCLNLFTWGSLTPKVQISGGYWGTYSWQAGGKHPTGMLSCWCFVVDFAEENRTCGEAPLCSQNSHKVASRVRTGLVRTIKNEYKSRNEQQEDTPCSGEMSEYSPWESACFTYILISTEHAFRHRYMQVYLLCAYLT